MENRAIEFKHVDKSDILRLALHNPIIHGALMYYQRGTFTWEEALAFIVVALDKETELLRKQLELAIETTPIRVELPLE